MTTPLIVLGSANRDFTVVVDRHPVPGETVLGGDILSGTGGKGANQAVSAARSGVTPVFVSAVGDDSTGHDLLAELTAAGVDVTHVQQRADAPTGVALITVAADGENTIVVAAGANGRLEADATSALVSSLVEPGTIVLAQLEIPLDVVTASATAASERGARIVLNLSPSQPLPTELLALCDPLVVNESEAAALVGHAVDSKDAAVDAARELSAGSRSVVITLGGDGVVLADDLGLVHRPAQKVTVVDTTGAGDAFVGALAAALALGSDLSDAVDAGVAAGALAVQHLGAQPPA
ncbi:ribokinase [Glaciihabitans sp. dw_435]|uniref:ribokinase n=1 Tax=Glaciihabitans sp. dw_435 TaxID=2720081 RepID=UPI001BD43964|nr:ribokinase [Glaciihabitans sp. dw_435]